MTKTFSSEMRKQIDLQAGAFLLASLQVGKRTHRKLCRHSSGFAIVVEWGAVKFLGLSQKFTTPTVLHPGEHELVEEEIYTLNHRTSLKVLSIERGTCTVKVW